MSITASTYVIVIVAVIYVRTVWILGFSLFGLSWGTCRPVIVIIAFRAGAMVVVTIFVGASTVIIICLPAGVGFDWRQTISINLLKARARHRTQISWSAIVWCRFVNQ